MRFEIFHVHTNVDMTLLLTWFIYMLTQSVFLEYEYVLYPIGTSFAYHFHWTLCWFWPVYLLSLQEYKTVTSPPVYISPLDLGPKYADKLGPGVHEYRKTYGENYCLGQLIYWYNQANADPDNCLFRASRGCLSLPEAGSFYAKVQKPSRQRVYGPRTVKFMLSRMVSFILISAEHPLYFVYC